MSTRSFHTIVEYFSENDGSRCGYCKSPNTSYSHGMWAHKMSVQDYQSLIDRGWRRSGCYCYKPIMDVTCCPMYTIRCAALEFNLSKSQKKIIKKFNRYVVADEGKESLSKASQDCKLFENTEMHEMRESIALEHLAKPKANEKACSSASFDLSVEITGCNTSRHDPAEEDATCNDSTSFPKKEKIARKTEDPEPSAPLQKKAKLLRKERKRIKLLNKGCTEEEVDAKLKPKIQQGKSLEEFLNEIISSSPAHKLEIHLVQSSPPSRGFEQTSQEAYEIYRKYQMAVHGDPPDKCSFRQYMRFLVNSPLQINLTGTNASEFLSSAEESYMLYQKYQLQIHNEPIEENFKEGFHSFLIDTPIEPWKPQHGPPDGYGSFHQQYWLDGKLIAVGVIDILPKCISSVYFYYDPDFAFLSLGSYGSLREIAMVRSVHQQAPSIKFYYMGYYIHSCFKMLYKANYKPSYLLCPEAYSWHPFEECKPKLDQQKYCRLNSDVTASDPEGNVDINEVLVLYKRTPTLYSLYKKFNECRPENEDEEVQQYAKLVGQHRSKTMLLYRADKSA